MIPWFPAVLIGEDYTAAVAFLREANPKLIVTDNTGVAYAAYKRGVPWIAGPLLNIVNSFSLLCLKENFACHGAFISNEINKHQIKSLKKPDKFDLYFCIYHPILLLSSRQCLFQPITGCEKSRIDGECLQKCSKSSSITNQHHATIFVEKTAGNYHCIYNDSNTLNTDIARDLPDFFSGFFIDLRDIATATKIWLDKARTIKLFENLIHDGSESKQALHQVIYPSTNSQYSKGI